MVRIRKNLKVSPLQFCSNVAPEDLQPHICKLNQSPWDLNPLPLDSSPHQFEAEDWFNGNVSLGNSIVAVESVASPMDIDKAEWAAVHADIDNVDKGILRCQKNDGRSWQCKKEAKQGFLFCEHHIRRSYNCNNNVTGNGNGNGNIPSDSLLSKKTSAAPAKALSGTRRARPKAVRKGASSANPYEYYYYSGFGPKWGRKRGKKDEDLEEEEDEAEAEAKIEAAAENDGTSSSTSTEHIDPQPSPPHNIDNGDQLDYMEDDFEDEDEDGSGEEGGRRRMRRPVKARSLMSIINVQAKE